MEFVSSTFGHYQRLVLSQTWPDNLPDFVTLMVGISVASALLIKVFTTLWKQCSYTGTAANRFLKMGYEIAEGNVSKDEMTRRMKRMRKVEEMLPPYPNGWFLLFQSDELKAGKSMDIYVCGMNLAAWREESGKVYVSDAYAKNEKVKAKIQMHHVIEQDGLVYFWFHAEGIEPEWTPHPQELVQGKGWKLRGFVDTYVNSHMQDIPENQADIVHFNFIHGPGYISGYHPHNNMFSFLEFVKFEYQGKWRPNEDAGRKHEASTANVTIDLILFGKYKFRGGILNTTQQGPGITCFHFSFPALGEWASSSAWIMTTPVQPMVQKMFMPAYSGPWVPSFFVTLIFEFFVVSVARDAAVWNRKTQLKNPIFVKEDAGIKLYRGWIKQFFTENSPRPDYFSELEY